MSDHRILTAGVAVAAAVVGVEAGVPAAEGDPWTIGPIELGTPQEAADILTRAYTPDEIRQRASGPTEAVDLLVFFAGRT